MEKEKSSLEELILEEMLSDLSTIEEFPTEIIDNIKGLITDNKLTDNNAWVRVLRMEKDPHEVN